MFCRTSATNTKKDHSVNRADKSPRLGLHNSFPIGYSKIQTGAAPYIHRKRFTLSSDTSTMGVGYQHQQIRVSAMATLLEKVFCRNPPCLGSAPAILMLPFELNMGNWARNEPLSSDPDPRLPQAEREWGSKESGLWFYPSLTWSQQENMIDLHKAE